MDVSLRSTAPLEIYQLLSTFSIYCAVVVMVAEYLAPPMYTPLYAFIEVFTYKAGWESSDPSNSARLVVAADYHRQCLVVG